MADVFTVITIVHRAWCSKYKKCCRRQSAVVLQRHSVKAHVKALVTHYFSFSVSCVTSVLGQVLCNCCIYIKATYVESI